MRVRRAQHVAMRLSGQGHVMLKPPEAGQQPLVLEAPHRLPDPELAHSSPFRCHPGAGRDPLVRTLDLYERAAAIMPDRMFRASGKVDPGFRRDHELWEAG